MSENRNGLNQGHYGMNYAYQQTESAKYAGPSDCQAQCERPSVLYAIKAHLSEQGKYLEDTNRKLAMFLERVYGPAPEPCSNETPKPTVTGTFREIEMVLEANQETLRRIMERVDRLSDIG